MKTIIKSVAVGAVAVFSLAAIPSEAAAWTCGARSATGGWGVGWSGSLWRAKRIALTHCAVNTPRGYVCRITYCT